MGVAYHNYFSLSSTKKSHSQSQ